ncbi:MAG: tRNA lysidine(34) synthetase TilS, partial [Methylibium sp.]|nr:tRNA lysidine(34) synthetase TilS [Methylibium sp.]
MSGSRATAATTTPRSAEPPRGLAVAYSGGHDSTALLHATLVAARETGLAVHALHVHHGLSAHADAWLAHCEAQCRRWARRGLPVAFHSVRVQLACRPGDSLEAVARTARYAALRTLAVEQGVALVLLAHHQRDQAETLLLQALRGAGVAGLAGLPASIE